MPPVVRVVNTFSFSGNSPSSAVHCGGWNCGGVPNSNLPEAVRYYEEALRINPASYKGYNNLAWLLAIHEPAQGGDPQMALELAQRSCGLKPDWPVSVDTLAAAYAVCGRFPEAISTAQKALDLSMAEKDQQLARQIQALLELYKKGKPYREPVIRRRLR